MSTRTLPLALATFAAASLLLTLSPEEARADITVGASAGAAIPTGDALDNQSVGYSFEGFAGYGLLPIPMIDLSAGLSGTFTGLPADDDKVGGTVNITRLMAQARARINLLIVSPELFVGVGYGWLSSEVAGVDFSDKGLAWQVGAGVGLLNLPLVSVGLYASYNGLQGSEEDPAGDTNAYNWIDVGVNARLSF